MSKHIETVSELITELLDDVAEPDKARIWVDGGDCYYDIKAIERIDGRDPPTFVLSRSETFEIIPPAENLNGGKDHK